MTKDEFNGIFLRLQKAFEHRVKEETAEVYFERFSAFEGNLFRSACEHLIETEKQFPRISKVLDAISISRLEKIRQDAQKLYTNPEPTKSCGKCSDGYVVYSKKDHSCVGNCVKEHTARCDCALGDLVREGKRLPRITEVFPEGVPF